MHVRRRIGLRPEWQARRPVLSNHSLPTRQPRKCKIHLTYSPTTFRSRTIKSNPFEKPRLEIFFPRRNSSQLCSPLALFVRCSHSSRRVVQPPLREGAELTWSSSPQEAHPEVGDPRRDQAALGSRTVLASAEFMRPPGGTGRRPGHQNDLIGKKPFGTPVK